jgi:hypothetical protein
MTSPTLLWIAVALAALAAALVAVRYRGESLRGALLAALAVPVGASALFFTLALHVHRSLGGWPETIGTRGFPEALVRHDGATSAAFGVLLVGLALSPIALLLCAAAPGLRAGLSPVATFAAAGVAALLLTHVAPEPFLSWWWD